MGLTVLLIVVNSIRMAVMSRAQEIEIMRLVGASDRYVRWPFIVEGVFIGLAGARHHAAAPARRLAAHQRPGQRDRRARCRSASTSSLTIQIVTIVMGAGLGLGGVGAWISVRTYLRR